MNSMEVHLTATEFKETKDKGKSIYNMFLNALFIRRDNLIIQWGQKIVKTKVNVPTKHSLTYTIYIAFLDLGIQIEGERVRE